MARLGRAEPAITWEKPNRILAPPNPPKQGRTSNINVSMTNSSTMR